jgi:hypothetical protein
MKIIKNPVSIDHVQDHSFSEDVQSAQLRQVIVKSYESRSLSNNFKDAFASAEDFDLPETTYEENRVTWIDVPLKWTEEQCVKHLESLTEACIYRVLSSEPILTTGDDNWMANLDEAEHSEYIDNVKDRQQVINPETGEIILHGGLTQYRAVYFSATAREDVDLRIEVEAAADYSGQAFQVNVGMSQEEVQADTTAQEIENTVEETVEAEPQF